MPPANSSFVLFRYRARQFGTGAGARMTVNIVNIRGLAESES